MGAFLARHQSKILALATVLFTATLIWLDERSRTDSGLPVGTQAPPIEAHVVRPAPKATKELDVRLLASKEEVTLASLHGKPAVLDFWATWCAPCRASLPHLDDLSKRYTGRVQFLAIDAEGEDEAVISETRDRLKLTMPIAVGGSSTAFLYHVAYLPTTVVLDGEGKIARTFTGPTAPDSIAATLDKLL